MLTGFTDGMEVLSGDKPKSDNILVIDRARWKTGTSGKGDTKLLNDLGFMCCLGFECSRNGIPDEELLGVGDPYYLNRLSRIDHLYPPDQSSAFADDAMYINDDTSYDNTRRELEITKHFSTIGVTVQFINEYPT